MTSKASFFNRSLLRRDLARSAPMLGLFVVIWVLLLPIGLASVFGMQGVQIIGADTEQIIHYILNANTIGMTASAFLTGMAAAWFMFHDFFAAKSANFYAQLPISRKAQFLTHYVCGLLIYVVPSFVIYAASAVVCHANGVPMLALLTEAFGAHILSYLFFYGFGVLCCMLISNAVAMPLLYLVLNFTVPVVSYILFNIIRIFTYGMPSEMPDWPTLFSPLLQLVKRSFQMEYDATGICIGGHIVIWPYLLSIAAVGIAMAIVSLLLFKKRKMETAGDVIAIPALRGVFRYAFTIGCALVIGMLIAMIVTVGNDQNVSPVTIAVCLIAGALIGNFAAMMMLKKTIHVFRKHWLGWIVCSVLIVLFIGALQLDVGGYERYVPDADTVKSITLGDNAYYRESQNPVTDAEVTQKVLALHKQFISEKQNLKELSAGYGEEAYYMQTLSLTYTLQNGSTVKRSYAYPVYYEEGRGQDPICEKTLALLNTPAVILANKAPAFPLSPAQFSYTTIDYYPSKEGEKSQNYTLGNREAYALFTECVLPDLADSSLGFSRIGVEEGLFTDYSLTFMITDENAQEQYFYYSVSKDAARTLAFLEEKGYLPE